jgi:hypothetical protein
MTQPEVRRRMQVGAQTRGCGRGTFDWGVGTKPLAFAAAAAPMGIE